MSRMAPAFPCAPLQLQMADHDVTMIVTRSGEAGCLVLATCALFDTRVFLVRFAAVPRS